MTRLEGALVRAADVLGALGKPYAVVGGIAVSALVAVRNAHRGRDLSAGLSKLRSRGAF